MTFEEIKQLLEVVREHELAEFELEREGFKIRVRKQPGRPAGRRARGACHGARTRASSRGGCGAYCGGARPRTRPTTMGRSSWPS